MKIDKKLISSVEKYIKWEVESTLSSVTYPKIEKVKDIEKAVKQYQNQKDSNEYEPLMVSVRGWKAWLRLKQEIKEQKKEMTKK